LNTSEIIQYLQKVTNVMVAMRF